MPSVERRITRDEPPIIGVLRLDEDHVALSGSLRLDINVNGPAPLRVDVLEGVLTQASATAWHIRPLDDAELSTLPDGRQEWTRSYRLDPFLPDEVVLAPAPIQVRAGSDEAFPLTFEPITVTVSTEITSTNSDLIRPVTDIERLPPDPTSATPIWWWLGPVVLVIAVGVVLLVRRSLRRPPTPIQPEEWMRLQLDHLETNQNEETTLEALAEAWRGYLSRRWGIATGRRTSSELLAELRRDDHLTHEQADILDEILSACDVAKFAPMLEGGSSAHVARSRELLEELTPESEVEA